MFQATLYPKNVYQASVNLSSNGKVFADSTVTFIAGESIVLQTGFWAKGGCDFHAYISDCAPAVAKTDESTSAKQSDISYTKQQAKIADIEVYPNPNNGTFIINNPSGAVGELRVLNSAGQVVYVGTLPETINNVHLSNIESGFYFIHIQIQGQAAIIKKMVIVQN